MAKKGGPSIKGMHIAFGIACVMLLITTVYAFVQDHFGRDFPKYQVQYDQLELARLEAEKQKIEQDFAAEDLQAQIQELQAQIESTQAEVATQQEKVSQARADLQKVDNELSYEMRVLNFDRAAMDEIKYKADAHIGGFSIENVQRQEAKIAEQFAKVDALKTRKDQLAKELTDVEANHKAAQSVYNRVVSVQKEANDKLQKAIGNPIIKVIKDAPGLDIVAPRHHIDQAVLPNLPVDVLFAKTQRVDRCVTCHQAIENPDPMYSDKEKMESVMRSHPRLDLFVGANSPHPYRTFGCTICHQGRPMGVDFTRATHMPRDAKQAEEWEAKYNWEPFEFWDQKMLPVQHTEASCLKCHKGLDNVPEAQKLNEGRHLFRDRGCTNCHMGAAGDKDMAWVGRIGPDLRRIGEKTDANWTRYWIENPWDFRPSTKMPRFFGLENRMDEVDGQLKPLTIKAGEQHLPRDPVEVEAITQYLFVTSKLREQAVADAPAGDVEAGRKLFSAVGCVGCHSTRNAPTDAEKFSFNEHGPDLSRIGEKVSAGWLFNWLKHPRHYWPETKMPDMRLSNKEAADITAYLMNIMKDPKAKVPTLAPAPEAAFDAIIKDKLITTTPDTKITELLKDPTALLVESLKKKVKYVTAPDGKTIKDYGDGEWTEPQIEKIKSLLNNDPRATKAFFAGETLIQHHGCFGCHNIQGWTYAPLTCVNLVGEADKDLDKLDFGKTLHDHSIPHTKWDWFYAKIARPRVYDMGKLDLIKPFDRLRMPWFGYTADKGAHGDHGAAEAGHAEGAHAHGKYAPGSTADASTQYGLTHTQVERLVTHLLSLTTEPVPVEMQHKATPKEIALDRGHRVVRELNCTGCHLAGIDTGADSLLAHFPRSVTVDSLIALLTTQAKKEYDDGVFMDEDLVSVDYSGKDASLEGFLNIKRGTYLTSLTVPILMSEFKVQAHALEPMVSINLKVEKGKRKPSKGNWVQINEVLTLERFQKNTVPAFYTSEEVAEKAFEKAKDWWVEQDAFERAAGTEVLREAGKLSYKDVEDRKAARKYFKPALVKVRFTKGEGRITPHIIAFDTARGVQNASQQQAPPSLAFEGGKVQPDWLYQFLHNVHELRPGLSVRMPSFWADGPYSSYKVIYPAGHLSAVDPAKRDKGIAGEPLAPTDALKIADVPDDSAELVEFFVADANRNAYGHQTLPLLTAEGKKLYEDGKKLVTGDEKTGGMGCLNCHGIGKRPPPEPKYAPDLAGVKRRMQGPWLRRFLLNPQTIYPWANMPNNFKFDWQENYNYNVHDPLRGMFDDEAKMKENADKLKAVHFYLMHTGEAELTAP